MADHGTPGRYSAGCRCEACRAANRARARQIRARLLARPRTEVPHGTPGGYTNWGCRCPDCFRAVKADKRGGEMSQT